MAFSGHIQLCTKEGKGSIEEADVFLRIQFSQQKKKHIKKAANISHFTVL